MRGSPLYALLCFQLANAPAALAAQPTWEAKRAHMAKEIKEALKSLDELDRTGPLCSENYLKSQCPSIMPPPKQTFVETAKKNLKALEKDVGSIAAEAKIADQPFDPKKLAGVDGCTGAGTSVAADAAKRKAAVDKMNGVFAKVASAISSDLGKLFEGGGGFKAKASACVDASNLNFAKKIVIKANLPDYPHGALDYMWTPDNAHKSCPRSGVDTFRKLTGTQKGDGNAQLARLAGSGKEYAANLSKNSAELANYTKVAGKVDCKSPDQTQVAAKPLDEKKPDVSGTQDDPAAKLAADETKTTPGEKPADPPTDETPGQTTAETPDTPPADTTAEAPPQDNSALTPEQPPADQKAGLSKGHVLAGLAVLGVGAGAAYLIFSNKDKGSDSSGPVPNPTGTQTNTQTSTQTATRTSTGTQSGTSTSSGTSSSTSTGPISSVPYTNTFTATASGTETATETQTSSETSTESGTSTETNTATSSDTSTSTATRE